MTAVAHDIGSRAVMHAAGHAPAQTTRMRLTRRGKAVVWALALIVSLGVWKLGGQAVAEAPAQPGPTYTISVQGGDTLWGIAAQVTPAGGDVRETIYRIMQANDMDSPDLVAGQVLVMPFADPR